MAASPWQRPSRRSVGLGRRVELGHLWRHGGHADQHARARAGLSMDRPEKHSTRGPCSQPYYRGGLCSGIDQRPHVTTLVDVSWGDTECGGEAACVRGRAGGPRGTVVRRTDASVDSSAFGPRRRLHGHGGRADRVRRMKNRLRQWCGAEKPRRHWRCRQHSATDDYGVQDREGPTHCPAVA